MGGWRDGWIGGRRDGRIGGRRGGCLYMYCLPPAGVLQIANNMYNNDVGKGVVYAYEAYEAK